MKDAEPTQSLVLALAKKAQLRAAPATKTMHSLLYTFRYSEFFRTGLCILNFDTFYEVPRRVFGVSERDLISLRYYLLKYWNWF